MARKRLILTAENLELLLNPMVSGRDVAKILQCTPIAIFYWRNKLKFNRLGELKKLYKKDIIRQFQSGISIEEIRKFYSAPSSFVVQVLREDKLIPEAKYQSREKAVYEHFDYKAALDKEIAKSAKYNKKSDKEYRDWIGNTKEGKIYFVFVQGHELELEYLRGEKTVRELIAYNEA